MKNTIELRSGISLRESLAAVEGEFGIHASSVDISKLAEVVIPDQIKDEIPTLNRMGYMKTAVDSYSQEFIDYASKSDLPVLEIGCAYGFVAGRVLENGGNIIATDLSAEHLAILLKKTNQEHLERLHLYEGSFPDNVDFPKKSVGAILISRVLHFLRGEVVEEGLDKMHGWLSDGGKLYFTAVSPYHVAFKEKFLPSFQERSRAGDKWPGVIENLWEIAPQHKEYVHEFLNIFDIPQLEGLLPKHGFTLDRISLFDFPNDTDSAGKGHVGFAATKV
ncbi:MAG: hypothetical protein COA94_03345 [Rickettsiales bacterium]|nr:MAG: hypothetical protein COA94_03345 [Rickettsiales bacterium]